MHTSTVWHQFHDGIKFLMSYRVRGGYYSRAETTIFPTEYASIPLKFHLSLFTLGIMLI